MHKLFFYLFVFLTPALHKAGLELPNNVVDVEAVVENLKKKDDKSNVYHKLNLADFGLSDEVFNLALTGHNSLLAQGKLENPDILTIVDFSQSSKNKRLYVIDFSQQELVHHTFVAHGRNTGDEFARNFSNTDGSWQSSLGFYITKNTNMGASVGFSLIMEGVEKGFNDNAKRRQIIVHGADYATEDFIKRTGRLGRSFGCPAVPPHQIKPIVNTIKNGSTLFIYYPDEDYLSNSTLLNSDQSNAIRQS